MPNKSSPVDAGASYPTSVNSTSVLPQTPEPEKLPTSAASTSVTSQPPAAYLPTGAVSPTPAPPGELGKMPEGGQGTPYAEGELEELKKQDPSGQTE